MIFSITYLLLQPCFCASAKDRENVVKHWIRLWNVSGAYYNDLLNLNPELFKNYTRTDLYAFENVFCVLPNVLLQKVTVVFSLVCRPDR